MTLNGERSVTRDLLLAADGSDSSFRHRFVPDAAEATRLCGLAGTLDDSEPPRLLAFFDDAFTFSEARSGGHILVCFIPGESVMFGLAIAARIGCGTRARMRATCARPAKREVHPNSPSW